MKNQKKLYVTYFVMMFALVLTTISTAQAVTFMVNVDLDQHDSAPGDGKCGAGFRACSLRAAIEETNALPGDDEIVFSDNFQAPAQRSRFEKSFDRRERFRWRIKESTASQNC